MIVYITRTTRHLLFWSLIAAALTITVVRILLAGLDNYQSELEQKIRQMTEIPVRIGKLEAGMRGFNPEIILQGIHVESENNKQNPDIQLKQIRLGFNFLDVLLTRSLFAAIRVTLVGAHLSVTRNLDGSLSVKGLQASDEQPLWLLQGGRYEILDSTITWLDHVRGGQPVDFDQFDLLIKNNFFNQNHEIHLLSRLPPQYGDLLRISALIKGNVFNADEVEGQLYIEGSDLQAGALATGDLPLGLNVQTGAGDIRLWSQWRHSHPYQIDGYFQGQQLKISKNQGPPLMMDTFSGSFSWSDNDGRWRLAGYDVNIFANHQNWPDGAFYVQQDAQGNLSVLVKQLDLPAAMLLAPLVVQDGHHYAEWLTLNPKGRLLDVSLFISHDFQHYASRGIVEGFGTDHFGAIPHIQNISGQFSVTDAYGEISLDTRHATLDASTWFRNPLQIEQIQGSLYWWQMESAWQFFSPHLSIDSVDFATVSHFNLWFPKTESAPILDLRTQFGAFTDISQVPKYLPAHIMSKDAVAWLDDAFVSGQVSQGELLVNGSLDRFPFADGKGRFETVFVIENGEIQFNQDWPHLKDVYADVQFLGPDLQVAISQGGSEKVGINQALVTIPGLADSDAVFVWGQVHAKFMETLAFLLNSPLKPKIAPIAKLISGEGDTRVDLDLKIPYVITDPVTVNVNAHLNGARLNVKPIDLKVSGIKGSLNFTEDRVSSNRMSAYALGYPLEAVLSSDEQATYLSIAGKTDIGNLVKQFNFLKNDVTAGSFAYNAKLSLPYDEHLADHLNINTSLAGLTIDSQIPIGKAAEETKLLNLDFQFDEHAKMPLSIAYGSQVRAVLLIDKEQQSLYSGHIVLGDVIPKPYDTAGLKIDIRQPRFDLSQTLTIFTGSDQMQQPQIKEFSIDTAQLIWQTHDMGPMNCHFLHQNQGWQGSLDTAMAKGNIQIPDQRNGDEKVRLQMDYLNLSAMGNLDIDSADEVVTELPLIDIDSQRLLWRSVNLGVLKLQTERVSNGIHFNRIHLQNAKTSIDLTVDWLKQALGTTTQVKGKLKTESFGELLSQLKFSDDIKETTADISFKGGWRGGPHQFALNRVNGQLQIELREGRISSIEPGFGRLLGLIAMEQWVKRLSLDFSDIYRQGLAFDEIKGRFKIKDGIAFTDDLVVDAVAAKFSLAGFANLADKTLDQRVLVVPKSSDALPIAGTIVGGIASMITQVVTGDYKEGYFFGSQYQLSGAWGNIEATPLHDEDGLIKKTWRGLTDFGWLDSITD